MGQPLRVVHVGLGPIGQGIARLVLETEGLKIVGASDLAPDKAGQDLGSVLGLARKLRVKVAADTARMLRKVRADVAVLSTSSSIREVKGQASLLLQKGLHVVSTCEEMAFPTAAHQSAFADLGRLARRKKVSILGTGVNPGYAMDALALMLTAPCARVGRVAVTRVVDASTRRLPLQRKVGAGLNVSQFRRALTEGTVRHVGLAESAHMIAAGLGWKLERVDETIEPAIAPRDLDSEYLRIPAGAVAGIRQHARAYRDGDLVISLDLQMYVGAESPRDHVLIDGVPPVDMTIAGGIAGDLGTAAVVVNSIPKLLAAPAGLVTMRDLPLVHRFNALDLRALPSRKRR
jgi:4-hydroxy-tetrahydrodipicolinate reductase